MGIMKRILFFHKSSDFSQLPLYCLWYGRSEQTGAYMYIYSKHEGS